MEVDLANNVAATQTQILAAADGLEMAELNAGRTDLGVLDGSRSVTDVALDNAHDSDSYAFRLTAPGGPVDRITITAIDPAATFSVSLAGCRQFLVP